MIERDDQPVSLLDDSKEARLPRSRKLLPLGPQAFRVEKAGTGIRVTITDRAHESADMVGSSSVEYDVYWAEDVDMTTPAGVSAGFARATLLAPGIPAPGSAGAEATGFFPDPQYLVGYFYCVGVDAEGNQSDPGQPVRIQSGTGGTVPPDVEHFQASESGEVHNGTTLSAISYSFRIPTNGSSIDRVQFYYLNYPNLNEMGEGESVRVTVGVGGTMTGKLLDPIGRRMGTGAITIAGANVTAPAGTGSFLAIAASAGGDQIEVMGTRARILSVTDNDTMTLAAPWAGPAVTAVTQWQVIGSVTIYAVSVGAHGERRDDPENAPHVTLDLDGVLSAPNAPTLVATAVGNMIRLEITVGVGTDLARCLLYRGTGAGVAFSSCSVLHAFEIDKNNATGTLQWDDSDFSLFDKENGQYFSYYAQTINVRDQPSAASARVEMSCRLLSSGDGSPGSGGPNGTKNLLWDAMLYGTQGSSVSTADAAQDTMMGGATSGGYNRWDGGAAGGTAPGFQNDTEIILPAPGAVGNWCQIKQRIGGWDNSTAANRRIQKGRNITFQIALRSSSPTPPNGYMTFILSMLDNVGNDVVYYHVKNRASDDTFDYTEGGAIPKHIVQGSILSQDHQLLYCTFSPQEFPPTVSITNATNATPIQITTSAAHGFSTGNRIVIAEVGGNTAANGTWTITKVDATNFTLDTSVGSGGYTTGGTACKAVEWVELRVTHWDTNNGNNLNVARAMLNYGDGLAAYTPELEDANIIPGTPPSGGVTPPGNIPDDDGTRKGRIEIPVI